MNDELTGAREEIDGIDRQMAMLFEQRMTAVERVLAYKQAHGLPVLDPGREQAVLKKNAELIHKEAYRPYYKEFLQALMAVSRRYQQDRQAQGIVGYQGVEGAFAHIALRRLFPGAQARAYRTWEDVFLAVERGEAAYGIIPLENSFAGDVAEVLDLLFAHDCAITAVYDLPVRQHLLGVPGASLSNIRQVLSHPQALSQCQAFLDLHEYEAVPCANTALAAREVSQAGDPSRAAIASRETAELYGLSILAADIQTRHDSVTRFIVLGRQREAHGNRFSVLFTVEHAVGRLAAVIQAIGEMGFNLECIKSRPLRDRPWEYYFYIEVVGDLGDERSALLMDRLAAVCTRVKVLGAYTVDPDRRTRGEEDGAWK